MNSIELTAPAKVNLFLKVLNKRRDSYHNILTVFERISLADHIKISKSQCGIAITTDKFVTREPKDNIAYKAADLILNYANSKRGVQIRIKKRIPMAAGLGGGSSDGAAVLVGMNRLFDIGLNKKELMRLAKRLGSDVPFFVLDTPFAIGKGRGEKLVSIKSKAIFWHLIIYPGFKLSTKDIYKALDEVRAQSKDLTLRRSSGSSGEHLPNHLTSSLYDDKIHRLLEDSARLDTLRAMMHNDLEYIAISKRPVIGKIVERLADILDTNVKLSGSGPSVFCLYKTRKEAARAKRKLMSSIPATERKGWELFIARTGCKN